jgi:hypothetical protein
MLIDVHENKHENQILHRVFEEGKNTPNKISKSTVFCALSYFCLGYFWAPCRLVFWGLRSLNAACPG